MSLGDVDPQDLLDLKLLDLSATWPAAAQAIISYRMACIGCEFSGFHTARQALEVYGLDEGEFLESLVTALRSVGRPHPGGLANPT